METACSWLGRKTDLAMPRGCCRMKQSLMPRLEITRRLLRWIRPEGPAAGPRAEASRCRCRWMRLGRTCWTTPLGLMSPTSTWSSAHRQVRLLPSLAVNLARSGGGTGTTAWWRCPTSSRPHPRLGPASRRSAPSAPCLRSLALLSGWWSTGAFSCASMRHLLPTPLRLISNASLFALASSGGHVVHPRVQALARSELLDRRGLSNASFEEMLGIGMASLGVVVAGREAALQVNPPQVTSWTAPPQPMRFADGSDPSDRYWIEVHGQDFGGSNLGPVAYVGGVECRATVWVNDTSVRCEAPNVAGSALVVSVSVGGSSSFDDQIARETNERTRSPVQDS